MNDPRTLIGKLWAAHEIVRREDGEWCAFHRHADPVEGSEPARDRLLGGAVESTGAR